MHAEPHPQLAALESSLRRYLPEQLASDLLSQPSLATARPCVAHLDALLHAVSTYLPRYLVGEQLRDPKPGQVSGQFREATIMFADISGFTAMSERLSRRGEEGAERITNIVGDYFTTMLEITTSLGGDLLKFGGDALLVAFFDADHAISGCRCAAQMQQAIGRFSRVEAFSDTFSLKMTVGLGSGQLFTANLGTAEKMEYTVMGQALAQMAHAEAQAEGGEIFADEATYQAVRPHIQIGETRNGCYLVTRVEGSESSGECAPKLEVLPQLRDDGLAAMASHIEKTVICLDTLVPFLPPGLLDLLRFDPTRMAGRAKGEFRPVTTFFANFYGIEEIIRQLGVEKTAEITAILNAHFSTMHEIIHRYEGVIDKVGSYAVGHRIMALFGAPRAHMDDPERAVRAAWEMQAAMSAFSELETSAGVFTLKQRIGVNTGRVFAGNVGSETRHEYTVMGDEVNLADRLMAAAAEGQVLISQSTAAQVGKRFRLRERGPVKVKGKEQPVPNYELLGVVERYEADRPARRSPLVGRDEEWQAVWRVAQKALNGDSQVLDIHGEVGLGKSRIIEELNHHWNQEGGAVFFAGCLSYGRHTPYAPWIALLREILGLRADDSDQDRREKITSRLATANPEWVEWAALVANLLGIPMPESDLLRSLDPKLRQQNLQRIVGSLITSEAEYHPTLLAIDDIQWIDEPSLSLFDTLTTHVKSQPLLLCAAYRPEEAPGLAASEQPNYASIALEALSGKDSLALLDSQLPTEPAMPERLKRLILQNAQGNPLFIVEMAHALIENYLTYDSTSGVYRARTDLDRVQVPDTVSRVILSRLDRLDEQSRNILKVASVIGREFQRWLLHSVYPYRTDEAEMGLRLLELCEKEILDRMQVAYLFRHVMTREVAYESLLYAERRDLHRKIAQSIEAQSAKVEESIEVLAEHYTLAEEWSQALKYHLKAGQRAQAIYANEDAIHRYHQALEIAQRVPGSLSERLTAYERLGDTHQLVGRYDESLAGYAQAYAVLDEMAVSPDAQRRRADLCRRTARVYECKSEYVTAEDWLDRGLDALGEYRQNLEAARLYLVRAGIYHRQGNNQQAIQWCKRAIEVASEIEGEEGAHEMAHASYLTGEIYRRHGDNEQAVQFAQRSLEIYQSLEDVVGQGQAHNTLANAYLEQSLWQAAKEHYRKSLAIRERIGDVYGQGVLAINIGEIYRITGQLEQAIPFYQHSLQIWDELGATYGKGLTHNNLGAVYVRMGDLEQAIHHLDQSETFFAQIPSTDFVAETSRYRAVVALRQGRLDEALAFAERSLKYALDQGLKADECATRRVQGAIYREKGDLERAEADLSRSLETAHELGNRYEIGRTTLQIGLLQRRQGKSDEARAALLQARTIFEELEANLDLAEVDAALSALD
jgi:class 3 adenylate cyclase/tetratricopeptide (TPR) repeat protein